MTGERTLEVPLVRFLMASSRVRHDSVVVHELAWNGRHVDISTLTNSGVLSAYELKMGNTGRAIEQAIYNSMSFDRSWIVMDRKVTPSNENLCALHRIGIIIVSEHRTYIQRAAALNQAERGIRRRLTNAILQGGKS